MHMREGLVLICWYALPRCVALICLYEWIKTLQIWILPVSNALSVIFSHLGDFVKKPTRQALLPETPISLHWWRYLLRMGGNLTDKHTRPGLSSGWIKMLQGKTSSLPLCFPFSKVTSSQVKMHDVMQPGFKSPHLCYSNQQKWSRKTEFMRMSWHTFFFPCLDVIKEKSWGCCFQGTPTL